MKYPFMPLFNGDILADTLHLSAQEFGAYMLLIIHAWKHEGRVPYDRASKIARVRADHWPKVFQQLEPFFEWEKDPESGYLISGTQHRVLAELLNADEISNKRKDAAVQMHSNRRANASHPQPHPLKDLSNGKGSEAAPPAQPRPQKQGMSPDQGNDYRSPPRTKSDNVLQPLPDKTVSRET